MMLQNAAQAYILWNILRSVIDSIHGVNVCELQHATIFQLSVCIELAPS